MTYIEFFDTTSSKNICTCLTHTPERVILIGNRIKQIKRYIGYYQKIFEKRGKNIEFIARSVSRNSLSGAVRMLTEIVETYDDCVFDITGGEEILLVALGMIRSQYPEKNIQIHRFNLTNSMLYDCDEDDESVFENVPSLTVDEQVQVYGGEVVRGDVHEEATYDWELTEEFVRDVRTIWNICKGNPGLWNVQISVFAAMEEVGMKSEDGLTVTARVSAVKDRLSQDDGKYVISWGVINALLQAGQITAFEEKEEEELTVSYKNPQVKRCLTKAGQALEMRVFLATLALKNDEGEAVCNDVVNGVLIDWDGEIHDQEDHVADTKNEIDVMMMRGVVPIFVSCKNGRVEPEEVYKLNTVAERFGGKHAKKVLVATGAFTGRKYESLCQRMEDMGIHWIDCVKTMRDEELRERLWKVICG